MKKFIFIVILLIVLLFLYARYIEPEHYKVNEYTIITSDIPDSFLDLKIVQFSDLLYDKDTDKLDKISKLINKEDADIVVFTGDLFNNKYTYKDSDYNNLKDFLTKIDASLYKYAVIGDNDNKYLNKYKDILYESNFILLDNENTLLFYKDNTPINIVGITNTKDITSLLETEVETNYNLVITHKPDLTKYLKEYEIDAILAGHSLGGVINIPYYGGLIKKDGAKTYIDKYYKVGNTQLYVNNGLGYKDINIRLFNSPSINTYRFKKGN